jgi:hypothetical protein
VRFNDQDITDQEAYDRLKLPSRQFFHRLMIECCNRDGFRDDSVVPGGKLTYLMMKSTQLWDALSFTDWRYAFGPHVQLPETVPYPTEFEL